jgi:hypothetical protein
VIYGWLLVSEIIALSDPDVRTTCLTPFAEHPHLRGRDRPSNTLYIAADSFVLPKFGASGGGTFLSLSTMRILTDVRQSNRSVWRLPAWLHPTEGTRLSYNGKAHQWRMDGSDCILSSYARGQELVLVPARQEAAEQWLHGIFSS